MDELIETEVKVELTPLEFHEIGKVSYLATHYSGDNKYRIYSEADTGITIALLMDDPNTKIIIARINGEIVGGIIGYVERHPFNRALLFCKIRTIVVSREHRKYGIGQKLLTALEEWAKERKACCICLTYHNDSMKSELEHFANKMGYEPFKYEVKKEL